MAIQPILNIKENVSLTRSGTLEKMAIKSSIGIFRENCLFNNFTKNSMLPSRFVVKTFNMTTRRILRYLITQRRFL